MISPHLLHIDASYSQRTYLGSLEGPPPAQVMIEHAKKQAKEMWGERATFVIEPPKGKLLPRWVHMVWATGPANNEGYDGSELVVIWWSEITPDTNRVLDAVDWEKNAKDFQF